MRIFVKNPNAQSICFGENQYPVKGQVVDVPDEVGASILSFGDHELYVGQVELHDDFVKADKKAADDAAKEAKKREKEEAEAKKAQEEADRLAAEEAARLAAEEAAKKAEEEGNTPAV